MKNFRYKISGNMKNSNFIELNSLAIGCHQNLNMKDINYVKVYLKSFLKQKI